MFSFPKRLSEMHRSNGSVYMRLPNTNSSFSFLFYILKTNEILVLRTYCEI